MRKIVFCGSIRFEQEMKEWAQELERAGFLAHSPTQDNKPIKELAQRHFEQLDSCHGVFMFNKGGYSGVSATMEFGYALAKGKPIWALSQDIDPSLGNFIQGVCTTPAELIEALNQA